MYTIVGGDGREYGPVTAEQLRQWIAEGRVAANTQAKAQGQTEWKALSQFPELAAVVAPTFPGALGAPAPYPTQPLRPPPKTSGMAVASLVLGIVGFFCGFFSALPGLILGIVGLKKIRDSDGQLTGKGLALAGVCVSVAALAFSVVMAFVLVKQIREMRDDFAGFGRSVPKYNSTVDECVGERLAAETAKLLNNQGQVVVLSMAENTKFKSVVAEAQMRGFRRGLANYSGITIQAVVGPDQAQMMEFFEGVSEKFLLKVLEEHPKADAIVSFMGIPVSAKEGSKLDQSKVPRFVGLNLSAMGQWRDLVKTGVVSAVVLPRYDVRWDQLPKQGSCTELFDSRYLIVTRDNLDEMSDKLSKFYPMPPTK